MRVRFQICPISLCSEGKKIDISRIYLLISNFLSSLKESVVYTSVKRRYVSKKTGQIKEYFSDRTVNLGDYSYDLDIFYPGGILVDLYIKDGEKNFSGRRFSILKRVLHDKAKESGIYIQIVPFFESPIKRKIIAQGNEIYSIIRTNGNLGKSLDKTYLQEIDAYLKFVYKNRKYIYTSSYLVYMVNFINYVFRKNISDFDGIPIIFYKGEPYDLLKDFLSLYLKTKDDSYLARFFLLLDHNYLVFRSFSSYYCFPYNDSSFLESYLGLPIFDDEKINVLIRKKMYQLFIEGRDNLDNSLNIYFILRNIFLYFMFVSKSFFEFKSNLLRFFSNIKFYRDYFTFSFRSISKVSISFKSIGFSSFNDMKKKIGKITVNSVLLQDTSLDRLLDEFEYALLSRF